AALFDQADAAGSGRASRAEMALLSQAGASQADPAIREVLWREGATNAELDATFVDSLLFWRDPVPAGTEIDAEAEAERLRQNAAAGKPAAEGETPVVIRRKRALLEGIF
ncbi:MAG: DUF3035 domain-containing protein, partial [Alphaproteobacteria bacterium]|nr:DUF3035 domain-containing protein [Alphaproteobacteria bacterium]